MNQNEDISEKVSFLGSVKWGGVGAIVSILALALAAVGLWLQIWQMNRPEVTGVIKIQRIMATSMLPPDYLAPGDAATMSLSISGESVAPGHLQLRMYMVSNMTGHHVAPSDFDSPITAQAMDGWKILSVEVTQPGNRPPVKVDRTSYRAVIPPLLLNTEGMTLIKVVMASRDPVSLFSDPFPNDDGVLKWTAEIKGAELQVMGAPKLKPVWLDSNVPGIYFSHKGMAIVALVVIALLLSLIQLAAMVWRHGKVDLTFARSVEVSVRLALAWATAEVLVSFADTMFTASFWANWITLVVYGASLLPLKTSPITKLFRRLSSPDTTA